jgi:CRP/FNR family transcriptional regulator, cyclic AMP receptor protein
MAADLTFLKSNKYFTGLSDDKLKLIERLIFAKKFDKGDIILNEGDPADDLYFVITGAVKTFRTSVDGKEQTLNIVHPGESFNDIAIFDNGPNVASARAMAPVTVYGILKNDFQTFFRNHPETALNVANVLASRVRFYISLIDELSFKPVTSRVAKILLQNAGNRAENGQRITQQDMAALAGTVREVIGRSLKTLERNNIIRMDRHRIIIQDKEALRNIAGVSL